MVLEQGHKPNTWKAQTYPTGEELFEMVIFYSKVRKESERVWFC